MVLLSREFIRKLARNNQKHKADRRLQVLRLSCKRNQVPTRRGLVSSLSSAIAEKAASFPVRGFSVVIAQAWLPGRAARTAR